MTLGYIGEYKETDIPAGTNVTYTPSVITKILSGYISTTKNNSTGTESVTISIIDTYTGITYNTIATANIASGSNGGAYDTTQYVIGTNITIAISISSGGTGSGAGAFDIIYMELE